MESDLSFPITKSMKETEQNIHELWENYKRCNIHIMGIPEGEERKEQRKYLK